jgi:hypothetical protein
MSSEMNPCPSCVNESIYYPLKETDRYSCDQPCLCRFNQGRSVKDKMLYDWFVLNKPMNIPKNGNLPPPKSNECNNQ